MWLPLPICSRDEPAQAIWSSPSVRKKREVDPLEEKVDILIRRGSVAKQQRFSMDGQYRVYTNSLQECVGGTLKDKHDFDLFL